MPSPPALPNLPFHIHLCAENGEQVNPFQVGKRSYAGNTLRAQATILLHETAHQITVSGFQPDNGIPKAGKANDNLVDQNCRQLIEGLQ
jgi:hypothetical protein